jgi:hypothetical protein
MEIFWSEYCDKYIWKLILGYNKDFKKIDVIFLPSFLEEYINIINRLIQLWISKSAIIVVNDFWVLNIFLRNNFKNIYMWRFLFHNITSWWKIFGYEFYRNFFILNNIKWIIIDCEYFRNDNIRQIKELKKDFSIWVIINNSFKWYTSRCHYVKKEIKNETECNYICREIKDISLVNWNYVYQKLYYSMIKVTSENLINVLPLIDMLFKYFNYTLSTIWYWQKNK